MEIDFTNTSQICIFIILATYIIMTVIKHLITSRYKCNNVIPPLAMIVGGVISFIIMKIEPGYLGTNSIFEGLTIGIISGGCATSVNQVAKKLGVCINLSNLIDTTETIEKPQNNESSASMTVVYDASGNAFYQDANGNKYPITIMMHHNDNITTKFDENQINNSSASTADYYDPNVVTTVTSDANNNPVRVTLRS